MLLVCVFTVDDQADDPARFPTRAGRAVALLSAQPGCRWAELGRSVDSPDEWVLAARFDSVTAYRRALSPFEVREHVVPLLAQCRTVVPSTYEVLAAGADGAVSSTDTLLAGDAATVARGPDGPGIPVDTGR